MAKKKINPPVVPLTRMEILKKANESLLTTAEILKKANDNIAATNIKIADNNRRLQRLLEKYQNEGITGHRSSYDTALSIPESLDLWLQRLRNFEADHLN